LYNSGKIGFGEAGNLLAAIEMDGLKCSQLGGAKCNKKAESHDFSQKSAEGDYEPSFNSLKERIEWMEFAVGDENWYQYEDDYIDVVLDIEEWNENNANNSKLSNLVKRYKKRTGWMDAESFSAEGSGKCPICKGEVFSNMEFGLMGYHISYCRNCDLSIHECKGSCDCSEDEGKNEIPLQNVFCECGFGQPYGSGMPCESCEPIAEKIESHNRKAQLKAKFSAESLKKDSCCCGATKSKPCACMIQGIMECSATCPCSLEKKAGF